MLAFFGVGRSLCFGWDKTFAPLPLWGVGGHIVLKGILFVLLSVPSVLSTDVRQLVDTVCSSCRIIFSF
jgi:hypothetical protein